MYVCMYVRTYVRMYVCMYACAERAWSPGQPRRRLCFSLLELLPVLAAWQIEARVSATKRRLRQKSRARHFPGGCLMVSL